ncbi:hypothetical protein JNUCC31_27575 [Paenibacillus sp. JNUCC31]|uniref:hypothetical protein n=1 Tax=Paenibacillus sp. JNUCC-31 TaxID=2777983 RepID=UPI00177C85D3|nr:hypothetical protein [Paenibacillus sp. JNUCC-31]QOS78428.1 hypothetical protein JNUCC31_27575 [Paenibacillus sp. JNUCC-31]
MIHLTRYLLKHYIRSQKYVAPVIFYIITMLLIYSYKPNPVADSYSVTAMLLFFGAAWLGLTVMNTESAGQYQLLVIHSGSKRKVAFAQLICALIMQFGLTAITVLYPIVTGMFGRLPSAGEWSMAWAGHLALSLLGLGLSVFFQKSYISMLSRSMPLFIVVLLVSLVQGSLSERLPESVQWLVKILPPAFYLVREMMLFEASKMGAVVSTTVWAVLYATVLLIIHIWLSGRRDLRS